MYKKIQTKSQPKKIVCEIINFGSPNLTKPKKKSRNIIKCHNIFLVPLFSIVGNPGLIFYILFYFDPYGIYTLVVGGCENIVITTKCCDIFTIKYIYFQLWWIMV